MKRKILAGIIIVALTASIVAGCGKKDVDYSLEGNSEAGTEDVFVNNDSSLEQFRGQDVWEDEWPVTDMYGEEHHIDVEAEIIVPNLENMRVIESTPLGGETFKKQCLESFFGADTEYYYHEEENYTREELEKWRPGETELIENASNERQVAEEFESVSSYAAYRDEILYEIHLTDTAVVMQPNWDEVAKCGPEQFRGYMQVDTGGDPIEGEDNQCKYSLEEAEEIADDFMQEIGLSTMERTETSPIVWRGNNTDTYDDESAYEYACYGYWFEYAAGIDGISFEQFPEPYQYVTWYASKTNPDFSLSVQGAAPYEQQGSDSIGSGKARILVTDDGIYSVTIENPEVIGAASNSVGLLPLDMIKEILEKEVIERTGKYDIRDYRAYNHLQLTYLKVSNETKKIVSAVPVWCFSWKSGNSYEHPVFVNAIDGTVIHYIDIEWSGEELPED